MWNLLKKPQTLVVAGVLGVGLWLGTKLDGLGLGTGGGSGVGLNKTPADAPRDTSHSPVSTDAVPDENNAGLPIDAPTLDIVIDGDTFAYRRRVNGKDEVAPATLDQVVELAKQRKGDREGIRVRIQRRGNALPSAEKQLADALREADVPDTAVVTLKGLLED